MKSKGPVQYTLRDVPRAVDTALRRKSAQKRKSLNATAIETLSAGLRLSGEAPLFNDLEFLIGSWVKDPKFDAAIREQDRVDPDLWR